MIGLGREGSQQQVPPPPMLPPRFPQGWSSDQAAESTHDAALRQLYYSMVAGMGTQLEPGLLVGMQSQSIPAWPETTLPHSYHESSQSQQGYVSGWSAWPSNPEVSQQQPHEPELAPVAATHADVQEEPETAEMNREFSSAVARFLATGDVLESDDEELLLGDSVPEGGDEQKPSLAEGDKEPFVSAARVESCAPQSEEQFCRMSTAEDLQAYLSELRRQPLGSEFTEEKVKSFNSKISSAILSLYRDRIKPVYSTVKRRLQEKKHSDEIIQAFVTLCAREPSQFTISLCAGEPGQFTIVLAKEPKWFAGWVDFDNPEGDYSKEVWEALAAYLKDENVILPGQPYSAALDLRERALPALENLCLGELEHVVRIALGKRNLLAVEGNYLRPAHVLNDSPSTTSDTKPKGSEMPASSSTSSAHPPEEKNAKTEIRCAEDMAVVMLHLMRSHRNGILLSNVKSALQSKYDCSLNMEVLCPLVLGRPTLLEVFKLQPLADIFPLNGSGKNVLVLPPRHEKIPESIWNIFYYGYSHDTWEPDVILPPRQTSTSQAGVHAVASQSAPSASAPQSAADRGLTPISLADSTIAPQPSSLANSTLSSQPMSDEFQSALSQILRMPGATQVAESFSLAQSLLPPALNYSVPAGFVPRPGGQTQPAADPFGGLSSQLHYLQQRCGSNRAAAHSLFNEYGGVLPHFLQQEIQSQSRYNVL